MNWIKLFWIGGGIVLACLLDLAYMFWSRSNPGHNFHRAGWQASGLGKGHYDVLGAARNYTNHKYGYK